MKHLLCSLAALVLTFGSMPASTSENERSLRLPPDSIGQWYKPHNKRQVWLHAMFSLRREFQAVEEYAEMKDADGVRKWSERLAKHYLSIGDMVPEWKDELETDVIDKLQQAAAKSDFPAIKGQTRKLGLSCRSCHRDYRAVTAALYRSPDFSAEKVANSDLKTEQPYEDAMEHLSVLVNRIKIAADDGHMDRAAEAHTELGRRLADLGKGCSRCHEDSAPLERILGSEIQRHMVDIKQGIERKDTKAVNLSLAEVAVGVCARCHGAHRTLFDLREAIAK